MNYPLADMNYRITLTTLYDVYDIDDLECMLDQGIAIRLGLADPVIVTEDEINNIYQWEKI